jgi:hypothetical protein
LHLVEHLLGHDSGNSQRNPFLLGPEALALALADRMQCRLPTLGGDRLGVTLRIDWPELEA